MNVARYALQVRSATTAEALGTIRPSPTEFEGSQTCAGASATKIVLICWLSVGLRPGFCTGKMNVAAVGTKRSGWLSGHHHVLSIRNSALFEIPDKRTARDLAGEDGDHTSAPLAFGKGGFVFAHIARPVVFEDLPML